MITSGKSYKIIGSESPEFVDVVDAEESDEERELTNLNWLLRNQNVTWPKINDANSEDDLNTNLVSVMETKKLNLPDLNTSHNIKSSTRKSITPNLVHYNESKKQGSTSVGEAPSKRLSPAERYDIFISKIKRDLAEYEKFEIKYKTDVTEKPPFNYSHIIGMAMLENGRVTLQQICAWIESKFAFFRARKKWNNSIRHNLSLHHCFRNRKREEKGKGGYWELGVDPKKCDRKRIRNRKTGQSKLMPKNLKEFETNSTPNLETVEKLDQLCYQYQENTHYMEAEKVAQLDLAELEVERSLGLSNLSNVLSSRLLHDDDNNAFLCQNELEMSAEELQPQYELGTIIISTTGIIDDSIINNKFNCTNMIYTEDEIPMSNENVIISSHMSTILDVNRDADISLVTPVVPSPEFPTNCEFPNFRAYIDGVDESFNYLHSSEIGNRNEDILDNLLDVCVRDY